MMDVPSIHKVESVGMSDIVTSFTLVKLLPQKVSFCKDFMSLRVNDWHVETDP